MDNNNKIIRHLHFIEDSVLALTVTAIIVFAFLQIVLRNLFGTGITWISPMLGVLVLWVSLLGALVATRSGDHIKINVITHFLPPKLQIFVQLIINLVSAMIVAIVAIYAVQFVKYELESTINAFANVPVWVSELIIPFAFGFMALRFLIHAGINFVRLFKRGKEL